MELRLQTHILHLKNNFVCLNHIYLFNLLLCMMHAFFEKLQLLSLSAVMFLKMQLLEKKEEMQY